MKFIRNNRFLLGFLFLAVLGFAVFSLGGEYLHSHIHHHPDEASHQQCPVYQLQTHIFTALCGLLVVLFFKTFCFYFVCNFQAPFIQSSYFLPEFRGPPVFVTS